MKAAVKSFIMINCIFHESLNYCSFIMKVPQTNVVWEKNKFRHLEHNFKTRKLKFSRSVQKFILMFPILSNSPFIWTFT